MHQINGYYCSFLKVKLNQESNSLYVPPRNQNHLYSDIKDQNNPLTSVTYCIFFSHMFYSEMWPSQNHGLELQQEGQNKLPGFPGPSPPSCSSHHNPVCRSGDRPCLESGQTPVGSPALPPSRDMALEQLTSLVQASVLPTIRWPDILHTFSLRTFSHTK